MGQFDFGAVFLMVLTIVVFVIPIFILFPPIPVDHRDALRQTHSRLGVSPHDSKLNNATKQQSQPGRSPRVESLFIYPLKSCRGIELTRSKVLPTGLEYDRLYTFAQLKSQKAARPGNSKKVDDTSNWEFVTQRQLPKLANVKVEVWIPDSAKKSRLLGEVKDSFIIVRFPWHQKGLSGLIQLLVAKVSGGLKAVPEKELVLPMDFPSEKDIEEHGYTFERVKVWNDVARALNMSKDIPSELASYLGTKHQLGLFRSDPGNQREVFRCAPRIEQLGYQPVVDFHDAYPVHLLSLSSVKALEKLVDEDEGIDTLDPRRFRGNIIVSGTEQYDEDSWRTVKFKNPKMYKENIIFDVSCRTVRCKLPNVDPRTGVRHASEPDSTLREYRDIDEGAPKMGCLGMQLCPVFPDAMTTTRPMSYVEIGMEIEVLERGSHFYIKQSPN